MTDARISRAATDAFIQPDTAARRVSWSLTDAALGDFPPPPRQASQTSTSVAIQPTSTPRQLSRVQTEALVPTWSNSVLSTQPVVYYQLDERSTDPKKGTDPWAPAVIARDSSGHGYDAAYNGTQDFELPSSYEDSQTVSLIPNDPRSRSHKLWAADRIGNFWVVANNGGGLTYPPELLNPDQGHTLMMVMGDYDIDVHDEVTPLIISGQRDIGLSIAPSYSNFSHYEHGIVRLIVNNGLQYSWPTTLDDRYLADDQAHLFILTVEPAVDSPPYDCRIRLWYDGAVVHDQIITRSTVWQYDMGNYELYVGGITGSSAQARFDDVAIWNRVLTNNEIQGLVKAWGPKPSIHGTYETHTYAGTPPAADFAGNSEVTLTPETVVEQATVLSGDSNLTLDSHVTVEGGGTLEGTSDASVYLPPPVIGGATFAARGDGEMYPASSRDLRLVFWVPKPTVKVTPSSVLGFVTNAQPHEEIDFVMRGKVIWSEEADSDGDIMGVSIPLTTQNHGEYQLYARPSQHRGRGSYSETITVRRDQYGSPRVIPPDQAPIEIPDADSTGHHHVQHGNAQQPYYDPAIHDRAYSHHKHRHWVFQDLAPGGLGSWVLPINPASQTSPHWKRALTVSHTTSSDGRDIVWQQSGQPTEWSFSGYCPNQEFHDNLLAYRKLPRRIYIIDHRNRAWVAVITNVDLVARNDPYNKWAHNYTASTLVHRYGDVVESHDDDYSGEYGRSDDDHSDDDVDHH